METGVSAWQLRDGCRMFVSWHCAAVRDDEFSKSEYRLGAEPGGLYTTLGVNLANSVQTYDFALTEVFTAVGLVTILGKMELFLPLCRGGVEIGQWSRREKSSGSDTIRGLPRDPTATRR
jgi:hypothetical protein